MTFKKKPFERNSNVATVIPNLDCPLLLGGHVLTKNDIHRPPMRAEDGEGMKTERYPAASRGEHK